MFKLDLEKAEEPEIKFLTSVGYKKQGNSRKTSASLTMLKPLTVWITTNGGKFLKRQEYFTLPEEIFFSWAPKSLHTVTAAMKLKDTCSL